MDSRGNFVNLFEEYETQHFGFLPRGLTDGMYNAAYSYLVDGVDTLKECMIRNYSDTIPNDEVEVGSINLLRSIMTKMDKVFDKVEVFLMSNVLVVPQNIVLPEDRIHIEHNVTEEKDAELNAKIMELEDQIQRANYAISVLKKVVEQQAALQQRMEDMLTKLDAIQNITSEIATNDTSIASTSQTLELNTMLKREFK